MSNPYTPKENSQLGSGRTAAKARGDIGCDYGPNSTDSGEGGASAGFGDGSTPGTHTGSSAGFGGADPKGPAGTKNAG